MCCLSFAVALALYASHCANSSVSGFAICPRRFACSAADGPRVAARTETPPRRSRKSTCEVPERYSSAWRCRSRRCLSRRYTSTLSSASRSAASGKASRVFRSRAVASSAPPPLRPPSPNSPSRDAKEEGEASFDDDDDDEAWRADAWPFSSMLALASVTQPVTRFRHMGWSWTSKPSEAQKLVLESISKASMVFLGWIRNISPMITLPTLDTVNLFGSSSVKHSWTMMSAVNSSGRLRFPSRSATQPTLVIFFAQTTWRYCTTP
mmetsp:Transcript_95914/g.241651  ORF Transcript_95914/g.241651 Transcript_95914/m.241651 type:complete len:265 (-) Transcript_95914:82-876(-)